MAVKILIYRRVRPGKEKELNEFVKELRSSDSHAWIYFRRDLAVHRRTLTTAGNQQLEKH